MECIGFTSSKGGVGTSKVVSEIAFALSTQGYKCAVIDAHCDSRSLEMYLGCEDSFVFDLCDFSEGLCLLDDVTIKINDNLDFIPCSLTKRIKDYKKLFSLLTQNADVYDFLLADVPCEFCDCESFSTIITVTTCEPVSVRCTEIFTQDLKITKKYLIINKVDADLVESGFHVNVDDICDRCGVPPIGIIPYDYNYFNAGIKNNYDCIKVFNNIADRFNNKSVCAIDFKVSKNYKKIFARR